MRQLFTITEIKPIDIKGGYLIDGFPSVGFTSAIATESLINTTQFDLVGFIDSDRFAPISLIRNSKSNFPTNIYVNNEFNVGIFSSYITLNETFHKFIARTMLQWAKKHNVSYVISSIAIKSPKIEKITAVGNTDAARTKIKEKGINILKQGMVPGIPGALLNQGMISNQNVIVILFNSSSEGPDFRSGADLCSVMAKLIPGVSCNIPALQKEAEKIEKIMKETKTETKNLSDGMYR